MGVPETSAAIAELIHPVEGVQITVPGKGTFTVTVKDLLARLYTLYHNDDKHHNGESLIQHISEVYDAVEAETMGWPEERRDLLRATALLHDLGKAYTHEYKNGRHTFYGHNEVSRDLAQTLLWEAIDWPDFSEQVFDLVLYHDVFFALMNNRVHAKGLKYLKKFARHPVSHGAQLENLVAFARADSGRSRTFQTETLVGIDTILSDLGKYRAQATAKTREREAQSRRVEVNLEQHWDEIASLIESAVPGGSTLLPDLKAVNRELGSAKRYDVIKAIQTILAR
jgi:putative nucleotidyltransferase with HDIG domain